jgi:hypothetical protein
MHKSYPPPKVGPNFSKQQMALFRLASFIGYFYLLVTENKNVYRLWSVLKNVLNFSYSLFHLRGVNPPIIWELFVLQITNVFGTSSQISWKAFTEKLWLLALYINFDSNFHSKKLSITEKSGRISLWIKYKLPVKWALKKWIWCEGDCKKIRLW